MLKGACEDTTSIKGFICQTWVIYGSRQLFFFFFLQKITLQLLLHNNFILQFETSAVGPTAAFVVLRLAIFIYRLFNERPGRGSFVSSHFVWVFLSTEGI